VKTGQPAEMPKRLRLHKWPHFMEKKFKPSYHSGKILGQLYDKVESVDFVPLYDAPFDKRILRAYKLDDATLKTARQIKTVYDIHMRRIMAQQGIKTEFEVWSTFVLSRPRVGSDYKAQEMMASISDGLKDQFRLTCYERIGSKDFSVLGPFAAAMYKVTKEEIDIALAECRQTRVLGGKVVPKRIKEPGSMPLISFPWLFEKELGRIATGMEIEDDLAGLGVLHLDSNKIGVRRKFGEEDSEDYLEQADGVLVHRGEVLDLFRSDVESDDLSGESDFEEARSSVLDPNEHSYVLGELGEPVLDTGSCEPPASQIHGGTGVEDVIPRTELDGFIQAPVQSYLIDHPAADEYPHPKIESHITSPKDPLPESFIDIQDPPMSVTADFQLQSMVKPSPPTVYAQMGPEEEEQLFNDEDEDEENDGDIEEVILDTEESSLEKLARMMDS
jgi:RNA-dependent RNA polymerase